MHKETRSSTYEKPHKSDHFVLGRHIRWGKRIEPEIEEEDQKKKKKKKKRQKEKNREGKERKIKRNKNERNTEKRMKETEDLCGETEIEKERRQKRGEGKEGREKERNKKKRVGAGGRGGRGGGEREREKKGRVKRKEQDRASSELVATHTAASRDRWLSPITARSRTTTLRAHVSWPANYSGKPRTKDRHRSAAEVNTCQQMTREYPNMDTSLVDADRSSGRHWGRRDKSSGKEGKRWRR